MTCRWSCDCAIFARAAAAIEPGGWDPAARPPTSYVRRPPRFGRPRLTRGHCGSSAGHCRYAKSKRMLKSAVVVSTKARYGFSLIFFTTYRPRNAPAMITGARMRSIWKVSQVIVCQMKM